METAQYGMHGEPGWIVGTELNAERQWRLVLNETTIPIPPVVGTELNAERQWRRRIKLSVMM